MTKTLPTLTKFRSLAVLSALAGLSLVAAIGVPESAEAGACGTVKHRFDSDTVYAIRVRAKRTSCRGARRLVRDFYSDRGVHRHGGPTNAETYYTLDRFPGWRCGTGASGGGCKKRGGRRIGWLSVRA